MSDLRPLVSDLATDDMDRQLVESWRSEQPSDEGRQKTLAALGLASTAGTIGVGTGIASVAPKAKAMATATLSLSKWIVLASVVVGALATTLVYVSVRNSEPVAPSASVVSKNAAAIVSSSPVAASSAIDVGDLDVAPPAVVAPNTPVSRNKDKHLDTTDALGTEIAIIDSARKALAAGDSARAESLATSYEGRFPKGTFMEEAQTLRIEALAQNGDRAKADLLARSFLAAHPSSPYAARVRSLLVGDKP